MRDVLVLGAGVVGLTAAVRLAEAGARVAVLTEDEPAGTVSRVAGAVWYPSRTSADPRVLDWARRTFEVLAGQAGQGVPGVVMRPTRMLLREPVTGNPWWASAVPDFRTVPPPDGYAGQWRFTVPTVEMGPYLDWLVERLAGLGVPVRRQRVDRLVDAVGIAAEVLPSADRPPLLVNATGLGAGKLADDPAVHPVRGRIVLVANPGLTTSVRDEGNPAGITYVHPRSRDVVLGGTVEPYRTETGPDDEAGAAILARCVALVPELAGAPVLGQLAGLRPGRHGGARVAEDVSGLAGPARLIHNYGHGGAGVTLGWGCADEVVTLAGG
ncbi:FAD-dependent oxidoreductase [Plantactinospora endophytica]|uniref:D-amino-acid oxidase n=1 Tax=Plantactinospora endophytica TaxID=673535 RepID=A0ABQ4E1Y1_9ACTN|nr:FAD-dependent oxidoreductase [Plantactinospora endophytica]GIG88306.1 D-amino-acid oxidase [Plantactinospora endophytica]